MVMPAFEPWTIDRVRDLPEDGNRYEVVDGTLLVTPAPSWAHQYAAFELARILADYCDRTQIGVVLVAPAEVVLGRSLVEPDVFVVPLVDGVAPRDTEHAERLLLVVEVRSPATARADRQIKRPLYQEHEIPEYWMVDPDARDVERWRPGDQRGELLAGTLEWRPAGAVAPLVIDLPRFFARVLDRRVPLTGR